MARQPQPDPHRLRGLPSRRPMPLLRIVLGLVVLGGYGAHAAWHVRHNTPWDAIWICHIAALMIGLGMVLGLARLNGAGFLCAALGLPSWLLYLIDGGDFIPTSVLTHALAPALALAGIHSFGLPRGSAALAFFLLIPLTAASWRFTPPDANVNLAFGPVAGLSLWTAGPPVHYAFLFGQWAVGLVLTQLAWRWLFDRFGWIRDPNLPGEEIN